MRKFPEEANPRKLPDPMCSSQQDRAVQASSTLPADLEFRLSTLVISSRTTKENDFTLFPQLPVEIQLKIFRLAIPAPRIIKLKTHVPRWLTHTGWPAKYSWEADQVAAVKALKFSTDTQPCGLLGACVASRETILAVYRSVIESKNCKIGKKIRFDGDNDTILLYTEEEPGIPRSPLGSMGNATLGGRDYSSIFLGVTKLICSHATDLVWMLAQFQSLKEVTLIPYGRYPCLKYDQDYEVDGEAHQQGLACGTVQSVVTLEAYLSPLCRSLEQWRRDNAETTQLVEDLHRMLLDWRNARQMTNWTLPKIVLRVLVWEAPLAA